NEELCDLCPLDCIGTRRPARVPSRRRLGTRAQHRRWSHWYRWTAGAVAHPPDRTADQCAGVPRDPRADHSGRWPDSTASAGDDALGAEPANDDAGERAEHVPQHAGARDVGLAAMSEE